MKKMLQIFLSKAIRPVKFLLSLFYYVISTPGIKEAVERPRINGYCRFGAKLIVGRNCNFNGAKTFGKGIVRIGDNFHSGAGFVALTQNHKYDGESIPYDRQVVIRDIQIADNVWCGMNVLLLPGVSIGEGAIIQAGSVVSGKIPDCAIAGGNPARVIKYRDLQHYQEKKMNGCFF